MQPKAAAELGARKAQNLLASGATSIAAANPGCTAQIDLALRELGRPLPIHHPIELLRQSIAAARDQAPAGAAGFGSDADTPLANA